MKYKLTSSFSLILLYTSLLVSCATAKTSEEEQQKVSIEVARKDLQNRNITPNSKKVIVSKVLTPKDHFKSKAKSDYWNRGHKLVGNNNFYIVMFSPKKQVLGGIHHYYFSLDTNKLLWVARFK